MSSNSFEGLQSGHEFILLEKTRIDLNKIRHYAWASGDYNTIHFDEASAIAMGLPTIIVHGMFELGLMTVSLEELIEQIYEGAKVKCIAKKIETRFVGVALVNDELSISAKISSTSEDSFSLQLFMYRNGDRSALTATGTAVIDLQHS